MLFKVSVIMITFAASGNTCTYSSVEHL